MSRRRSDSLGQVPGVVFRVLLPGVLILGAAAVPLDAATLRMEWASTNGATLDLYSTGEAEVEVWVDLLSGETLSTVIFSNSPDDYSRQIDTTASASNWADGSVDGLLGGSVQQVALAASASTNGILDGPGTHLMGTQTIRLDGAVALGRVPGSGVRVSIWSCLPPFPA
ncbi:MAG: hypothetical protein GY842_11775 [bacterium]|nr:hypothetical protein [bacterium]